jgi:hypothetical protein
MRVSSQNSLNDDQLFQIGGPALDGVDNYLTKWMVSATRSVTGIQRFALEVNKRKNS